MAMESALLTNLINGYAFTTDCLELGAAIVDGAARPEAQVRVPLSMLNRHGLITGATGTGKTVTLQVMAEQLAVAGVPVFLADLKGDLSGLAQPAEPSAKLDERLAGIGHRFTARSNKVEFLVLGQGPGGIPVRATVDSFGPILLARVLELNETQEQVLQLVFHYADTRKLPLDDLKDLKSVLEFLLGPEGKEDLRSLGGVSPASASVILRGLTILQAQGMDPFFGQPEFDTADLLRSEGTGIISVLELPALNRQPLLFSTFLMWLLADLFDELPEAGDLDKPKLVFFLDEAHLLFKGASKAFTEAIISTVRLIRSKGVGLFFISQSPADLPDEVLAQLGTRVQHAVRVFTPKDAEALKEVMGTFPAGELDLKTALTQAGVGEAVITVLGEKGVPTPAAWTRLSSPGSRIGPADASVVSGIIAASALAARYSTALDRDSAHEMLTGQPAAAQPAQAQPAAQPANQPGTPEPASASSQGGPATSADIDEEARRIAESILGKPTTVPASDFPMPDYQQGPEPEPAPRSRRKDSTPQDSTSSRRPAERTQSSELMDFALDAANMLGREVLRGMFGTRKRKRR
ncbi:helicase HerA-like domain-containing protein [Arthrobacter sp. AG1021]|uniref:helicase HerA-like domain-containing protein n=1 Tax=Arthrobacter sp. AG1021 TaxID=2183908 RepID=UPI000EAFFA33|nr:helicase HerA-like domain-containing protein [Arthrobacter sp. AG1021]